MVQPDARKLLNYSPNMSKNDQKADREISKKLGKIPREAASPETNTSFKGDLK